MSSIILTVNGGSSSLKFAVYAAEDALPRIASGAIERIGLPDSRLEIAVSGDSSGTTRKIAAADSAQAVATLIDELGQRFGLDGVGAIGHRVVHGGERYRESSVIDDSLVDELRRLSPLDPAHLPGEIAIIDAFRRCLPQALQVACFDTAFHRDLPRVAQLLPIPRRYLDAGVRRYGFHGLSYTWLLQELERIAGAHAARGRVIFAHLGSGCSLAAVHNGKCVETTMGFTPTSGLVMGRRSGDVDPGLLVHLLRTEEMSADELDDLLNRQSGLIGVSEISPDVRDLLAQEETDVRAAEALAVFCYSVRKAIGACAAALGGLDTLVFSAGIGENSAVIRSRICSDLRFLGIALDDDRNNAQAQVISADSAPACVRVIPTDEEAVIARDVVRLLQSSSNH